MLIVEKGSGEIIFENERYALSKGDCAFIGCNDTYSHETSDDLWSLQWLHFYSINMDEIYAKYKARGGKPIFHPEKLGSFQALWAKLIKLADSSDYIRDMRINEGLNQLLTLLMEESWHTDEQHKSQKRKDLVVVHDYMVEHYAEKITLDDLSDKFYINKYYLTRIFKAQYGISITNFLMQIRITHAKRMLRFSDKTVESIGYQCGVGAPNYFCRTFRKIEGLSPSEFREKWKSQ